MSDTISHSTHAPLELTPDVPASARTVLRLLQGLPHGSLALQWPNGQWQQFGTGAGLHASLRLHRWEVLTQTLASGDIGFAEGYIAGHWSTPNLSQLLRLLIVNRRHLEDAIYGNWLGRLVHRMRHLLNRNTRTNSAKNVQAHYDLGNAFYELWLDPTMLYSSALFEGNFALSLQEAQWAKVRRTLDMAGVKAGAQQRVLEIGCGWGALAELGAREYGARITGVTLSHEQLAYARQRMRWHDLQADLRLQDYRDIGDGPYDAICSIEMLEAVGQAYWPTYFQSLNRLLKPGGRACVQSIVIDDALFDRYIQGTDFIQQYIFPGGCLPSPHHVQRQAQAAGLDIIDALSFGGDYAETLRRWREQFLAEREHVHLLGFDDAFVRTWEFYLCYCEAAFAEGNIDVVQYTFHKPT